MRLLSICPRVRKRDDCLVASTAWRVLVMTLGVLYRRLVVNPQAGMLTITSRYLWFFTRRREFPFQSIRAITYGYEDLFSEQEMFTFSHDSYDWFMVGLRLQDGTERHVFNFFGEGTFSSHGPWPEWLYWDNYALDMSGSQEKESRAFVDILSKLIGAPVVPPRLY